ncbi:DsbA family protein [Oceanibium sediminis]|uniref:DsbA family protein n=1 Tax=Oceanibium sediminis TaxID=2026339 RepID=UPI000DD3737B|nr:DsbA family protein [Oceanibium sediminis]
MKPNALTRRQALAAGATAAGSLLLPAPLFAQDAPRAVETMILGAEDAPVSVVEYASLTCPHCANFHTNVFGKLKANYIETGKIRFEMRDVYFDRYGLWGAMVARCGGQERYFGIIDRLYTRQAEWSRLSEPTEVIAALFAIGRQAGLTDEQMDACVQDQAFAEALVAEFQKNSEADGVNSTPTFFINGRKESNMSYEDFAAKIDAELES